MMLRKEAFPYIAKGKYRFTTITEEGERHKDPHVVAKAADGRSAVFRLPVRTSQIIFVKGSLRDEECNEARKILEKDKLLRSQLVDMHFAARLGGYPKDRKKKSG